MPKPLRDFVAFDLETTGLERDADEIIEIGAVRVRGGLIEDRMSCLIKAGKALSPLVESLTGISAAMLADARDPKDGLEEFLRFAGDLPLVAHNSDFDSAFLAQGLAKAGLPPLANKIYDSLLLARIAWPAFDSHRLESLVGSLGIPPQTAHRALPDAEQAALLWLKAEEKIAGCSPETLAMLGHVLASGPALWRDILGTGSGEAPGAFSPDALARFAMPRPVPKDEPAGLAPSANPAPDPELSTEALFASSRPAEAFASLGRSYAQRARQSRMAALVERALGESRILMAEAEPGTGRMLASLAAALRHARSRRRPVFVAVPGKARIAGIVTSEIPLLKALCGADARVTVLKAPSSYPSPRKLAGILAHPETRLSAEERLAILPLLTWLETAGDGDIGGSMGFNHERNRLLWSKLAADSYASEPGSHAHAARERAGRAHIVLIPHDLLLEDMALDFALLPAYEAVIIDEAHKLPETGQTRLGREITFFRLKHILQLLAQSKSDASGLLAELERGAGIQAPATGADEAGVDMAAIDSTAAESEVGAGSTAGAAGESDLARLRRLAFEPERQLQKFFNKIAKHAQKRRKDGENRIRYADKLVIEFNAGPEAVVSAMADLEELLGRIAGTREDLAPELRKAADLLRAFRSDLEHLAHPSGDGEVYWIEDFPNPHRALIRSSPREIGPILAEKFYPQMEAVVFSSAALAVGDDFSFFRDRLGLDAGLGDRLKTALVRAAPEKPGTPAEPGREEPPAPVLIARFSPVLNNNGALQGLAAIAIRGLQRFARPSFLLFTHIGMLKQARALLQDGLAVNGRMVLAQHVDGSREGLLHLFRSKKDACLLGTEAFVENLDAAAAIPEIAMVTKLPFPVPTDPLVAPRLEKLQEAGRNPLYDYLLPASILKLKQDLNRLPQLSGRRPVIWILDPRLATEKYARVYQRGLGRGAVVCDNEEALTAETAKVLGD